MDTDTLIVGGGLSGLALADKLEQRGQDWQLLEASDTLGGRILSTTIRGQSFDLGPAWVWPGQPRIDQLLHRFNLTVFEQFSDGRVLFQDASGKIYSDQGISSMRGSLRIEGGIYQLIQALTDNLPSDRISLQNKVSGLASKNGVVEATSGHLKITAKQVVLAVPPRVITHSINFSPSIDVEKIQRLQSIPTWMAGQAKVIAVYDQPYWRQNGFSGDAMSQHGPLVEIHDASPNRGGPYALFGFVGIPAQYRGSQAGSIIKMATAQLVTLFGSQLEHPLEVQMQDWSQVTTISTPLDKEAPTAHPSYGYPLELQELWNKQLLFGSTEMASSFGGYLEGALEIAEVIYHQLENTVV